MKIAVFGAAGGVGHHCVRQALAAGHGVRGLVRQEAQARSLEETEAEAVLGDLQGDWQDVLTGTDAVVWAAGAGRGGNYDAIDGDALIALADTLAAQGPRRLVVVSSLAVDRPDTMPPMLAAVLRVKARSDAHVQASGLDWTVVRPGGLVDKPATARVQVGPRLSGSVPREDVAGVVLACLEDARTVRQTFEVVAGEQTYAAALAEFLAN